MDVYQTALRRSSGADPQLSSAPNDSVPPDFDPASHPIISRHFFGIEPLRPIGEVTAEIAAEAISGLNLPHRIEPVRQPGLSVFGAAQRSTPQMNLPERF